MKQLSLICSVLLISMIIGAAGCGGDPNVEGAKLALQQGDVDYEEYYTKLDESISNDPANAEAHYVKALLMKDQLKNVRDLDERSMLVEKMAQSFNEATELDPENVEYRNVVTEAYYEQFREGLDSYNRGLEDADAYAEAARHFKNASLILPDSAGSHVNQAYSLMRSGNSKDAIEPLEKAIELGDSSAVIYTDLSGLYEQEGMMDEAIALLVKAQELYPEDQNLRGQLLNAYISTGQIEKAMSDYKAAVDSEPDNKLYRFNYGTLLSNADNYDEAIEQFNVALEIDPEYGDAHHNLGAAYANKAISKMNAYKKIDDRVMENKSSMSEGEINEADKDKEALLQESKDLFSKSIPFLERARDLKSAEGENVKDICFSLFQALAQIQGDEQKIKEAGECAELELEG